MDSRLSEICKSCNSRCHVRFGSVQLSFIAPAQSTLLQNGTAHQNNQEMAIAKEEARTNAQAADKGEVTTNA